MCEVVCECVGTVCVALLQAFIQKLCRGGFKQQMQKLYTVFACHCTMWYHLDNNSNTGLTSFHTWHMLIMFSLNTYLKTIGHYDDVRHIVTTFGT